MSYPVLYDANEKEFAHGGFGFLSDCIQCEVTEEANGEFELFMRYPIDGIHFEDVNTRCIIKARLDDYRDPQLFRIYSISKPMSKIVTIRAHHISYDLSGVPVSPFSASSAQNALSGLKQNAAVDCPFEFWTDKETTENFIVAVPSSIRSTLGGSVGSVLDVFGGEYEFDNYTVKLYNNRGEDRGVFIRYGKNLLDINQEENVSSVATGVYPYWSDFETGEVLELPEKIINAPGQYDFIKILPLDASYDFIEKPTEDELRYFAEKYVSENQIGTPSVSLSVSFAQIANSEEYAHLRLLERVGLFDTISVEFPLMKVSTKAKVVRMVYDILLDKVKSVQVGSLRTNIADTVATLKNNQGR